MRKRLRKKMDYHYDDNTFKKLSRRHRVLWIGVLIVLVVFTIISLVIYDGLTANTTVTEVKSETATLGETVEQKVFDEETYTLTTDPNWREADPFQTRLNAKKYQSIVNGLVVRDLEVYVNDKPFEFPSTHVIPVEIEGNKLIPLGVSPKCDTLQKNKKNKRDV
ncbi:MAG: hypothetical protein R3313_04435, partial [Candidatus Saccharimonadales bacterium]|nr:hypothetical protein [Candidatus Saccharimonadales bacterium]